ncbi:hypothetical protein [Actinokineospora sp. NPDC004072]
MLAAIVVAIAIALFGSMAEVPDSCPFVGAAAVVVCDESGSVEDGQDVVQRKDKGVVLPAQRCAAGQADWPLRTAVPVPPVARGSPVGMSISA